MSRSQPARINLQEDEYIVLIGKKLYTLIQLLKQTSLKSTCKNAEVTYENFQQELSKYWAKE